jgi:protein tyrosine phosphatase
VSASLANNKAKNRLVHILPYESSRVSLQPIRGVEGSDYINASFVDGYKYRSAYIATQGPLPETVEDLWRMLWEHNSNIIVMLTKLKEMGRVCQNQLVQEALFLLLEDFMSNLYVLFETVQGEFVCLLDKNPQKMAFPSC